MSETVISCVEDPSLGPCPFCGESLRLLRIKSVWDRGTYEDGDRYSVKARCVDCKFDLPGPGANNYSSNSFDWTPLEEKLREQWSFRTPDKTFVKSNIAFQDDPEGCLKLRVYGHLAIVKEDAARTAAPLMFFEQLDG